MLWKKGRQSDNVEDRRGASIGGSTIKLSGGMLVVVMLIGVVLGENPLELLAMLSQGFIGGSSTTTRSPPGKRLATMNPLNLYPPYWRIPKIPGPRFSLVWACNIKRQSWFCFPIRFHPHADIIPPLQGLSIVLAIERFTSIWGFSGNWITWAPRAISLKRMSLATRSVIMCKTSWGYPAKSMICNSVAVRLKPMLYRSYWNYKRIVLRGYGLTMPINIAVFWSQEMSMKASGPPPQ